MEEMLQELAHINYSGAPFLVAYGLTWLLCGFIWQRGNEKLAALATLFQGMAALPLALLILFFIGALSQRPDIGLLNHLVIIIAMSQLLALPLLISMFKQEDFRLIPFVFSLAGTIHFVMYAWLYQTSAYILMSITIAVGLAVIYNRDKGKAAALACYSTGIILWLTAGWFILTT